MRMGGAGRGVLAGDDVLTVAVGHVDLKAVLPQDLPCLQDRLALHLGHRALAAVVVLAERVPPLALALGDRHLHRVAAVDLLAGWRVLGDHDVLGLARLRVLLDPLDVQAELGEDRVGVVAHQPAAQRNGMRAEIRCASFLRLHRGYVEGLVLFQLQLVMVHHGVGSAHNLGHRVGEVDLVAQTDIALHHRHLAFPFGENQVARMSHRRLRAAY